MKYNFNKLKEIVKSKMSLKRFTHTLGVVEMSEKLAKIYRQYSFLQHSINNYTRRYFFG